MTRMSASCLRVCHHAPLTLCALSPLTPPPIISLHHSWEGGVRVNAFISGGFVTPAVRGTVAEGLVAVEDWLATFCALAGVDPTDKRAAAAGLPPIDSLDQWPYLSGSNKTSPRTEVWLGADSPVGGEQDAAFVQGLITSDGGWKLLIDLVYMDVYSG